MPSAALRSRGLRRWLPFLAGVGVPGAARGAQQFRENGYQGRVFNLIRQPLPDSGTARVFRAGRADCCPFLRAQRRARQTARFPPFRPIGGHLFRIRFLTGLICRGASPPPDDSAGIPPSGHSCLLSIRSVIVHVHVANAAPTRAGARGVDGRWTDGRSPRVTAGRAAYPNALRMPQSTPEDLTHTRSRIGHRSRAYGDPGASWHAQRSSRHAAEPTHQATPVSVP